MASARRPSASAEGQSQSNDIYAHCRRACASASSGLNCSACCASCRTRSQPSVGSSHALSVFIETTTDNANRTVAEIRHAFSRNGGHLGGFAIAF
jgi:hypothetical protein